MAETVIKIENLYKEYRLGVIGHGTLYRDLQSWWARVQGKEDPNSIIGHEDRGVKNENILALNNINLEIKQGEILGVVGANGAGKSTLLKILSRVTTPTRGLIKIKGRIASLLEVGTGFHTELTGRENIYLNGSINGMGRNEVTKKLNRVIEFAGVEKFIDTPVKRYSSGMYVRLGFAVAAHLDPDILIVDEVLAVGDIEFQKKAIGKMQEASSKQGRTILFVSHNMPVIKSLCAKAILLEKGKIIYAGATEKVIEKYVAGNGKNLRGEKIWTSPSKSNWPKGVIPGKELGMLKAVRVLDESGLVCTNFTVRDNIYLQAVCQIYRQAKYMDVGFNIYNEKGDFVFCMSDDSRDNDNRKAYPGLYQFTVKIPGDLLNDSQYFVLVGLSEDGHIVHIRERDVLLFVVKDSMDPKGSRGCYFSPNWPRAIVRPKFEWEVKRI